MKETFNIKAHTRTHTHTHTHTHKYLQYNVTYRVFKLISA